MSDEETTPYGEPLFTREEAVELFRFIKEEASETFDEAIDAFAETGRPKVDPSDLTESILDLMLLGAQAAASANPVVALAVASIGPAAKDMVVTAVQKAEEKALEPANLIKRITRAEENAKRATERADKLAATPEKEIFEKLRIRVSRRRARNQTDHAKYLKLLLSTAEGSP